MDNTLIETPDVNVASEQIAPTEQERVRIVPPVDVFENSDELLLRVDMPGVREDAVELRLERRTLSLRGDASGSDRTFARTFTLPDTVDGSAVTAVMSQGVLEVHLAKREDTKARTIAVSAR